LNSYKGKEALTLKQESAILHIYCGSLENAEQLIEVARRSGFKRAGIITAKKHIIVEIICLEQLAVPVFNKKLLIPEKYLNYLIKEANKKLERSWTCIKRLRENSFFTPP